MRARYAETNEMSESFPYKLKAIYAFQEIDGVEVCFFGLYVQEYGSESAPPNTRRVYISYLDSVYYFQPRQYRTDVYHEILLGYLMFAKKSNFSMAHIWSCPPGEGDDYIFHMHPPDQKIPKEKRLIDWYVNMLRKALIELIVADYKDILKDSIENNLVSPAEIPYFDGDFWPNTLEDILKEYEEEAERRRKDEENSNAGDDVTVNEYPVVDYDKRGKKKTKKRKEKRNSTLLPNKRKKTMYGCFDGGTELCRKVYDVMEKVKHLLFVIRLTPSQEVTSLPDTKDPDPLVQSDLMESRDAFLQLCREKNLEFSSLRRAKYSSMVMLYEIHNERRHNFIYNCCECGEQMETRYHCNECEEYDICAKCKETKPHQHDLVTIGFGLDDDDNERSEQEAVKSKRVGIDNCIKALLHACQCRDANCRMNNCLRMKRIVQHTKSCNKKAICETCKQLIALCFYHAKICKEHKCFIPFCYNIKLRLKQKKAQQQFQQNQSVRRRCNAMLNTDSNDNNNRYAGYPANVPSLSQADNTSTSGIMVGHTIGYTAAAPNNSSMIISQSANAAYNAASQAKKHANQQKMSTVTSPIVNIITEPQSISIQNQLSHQIPPKINIVNGNMPIPPREQIHKVHQVIAEIKRTYPQEDQNLQNWLESNPQFKSTFNYIRTKKLQSANQQHEQQQQQQQHQQQQQQQQHVQSINRVAPSTLNNSQLRLGIPSTNQMMNNQLTNRSLLSTSSINNSLIVQQQQQQQQQQTPTRQMTIALSPQIRQLTNPVQQQFQMRICQSTQNNNSNSNNIIYSSNINKPNNHFTNNTFQLCQPIIGSSNNNSNQQQQQQVNYISSRQQVTSSQQQNLISIKKPVVAQVISTGGGGVSGQSTFIVPQSGGVSGSINHSQLMQMQANNTGNHLQQQNIVGVSGNNPGGGSRVIMTVIPQQQHTSSQPAPPLSSSSSSSSSSSQCRQDNNNYH